MVASSHRMKRPLCQIFSVGVNIASIITGQQSPLVAHALACAGVLHSRLGPVFPSAALVLGKGSHPLCGRCFRLPTARTRPGANAPLLRIMRRPDAALGPVVEFAQV